MKKRERERERERWREGKTLFFIKLSNQKCELVIIEKNASKISNHHQSLYNEG